MYKQLGLGKLKPTNITLSLVDRSVKIPKGIVEDVLVKVDKFYYPVDFVVLDTEPIASGPTMCRLSWEDHFWPLPMQPSNLGLKKTKGKSWNFSYYFSRSPCVDSLVF